MEQRKYEETEQNVFDFKHQNIITGVEKSSILSPGSVQRPGIVGTQHLETGIASLTPEKTNEASHIKQKKEVAELPERCRTIAEFFYRMTCSLRLLSLRKKSPTFGNISTQVEILTGRKFSYKHIAQIKYILPEAVETDKILIYDEKTLCMKPDIKITLLFDVVDGHHELSPFTALHQLFASRLWIFFRTHPEGCEIPEAILPELFNQRGDAISKGLPMDSSTESQPTSTETGPVLSSSHLYPSFSRHFSQKAVAGETDKSQLVASPVPLSSVRYDWLTNQDIESGKQKKSPDLSLSSKSTLLMNPPQLTYTQFCVSSTACESTPMKLASEDDSLLVETPAQLTPKRSMPSCDDKVKTTAGQKSTVCHMSAKRSLDFSLPEGEESASNFTDEIEQCKVIRNTIPQTVETKGTFVEESTTCSAALLQKVEENDGCTSKDHKMNQTGSISHQQMSACLSDLVGLIHHIFQSVNCSSITREELMHKIIMKNCDIVESREVEEQIELLEKLVPDWICRKLAPSGDVLYNIRKVSDLNSIRERLISM